MSEADYRKNNKNRTVTRILEEQESFPEVFKISVKELFKELKSHKADIFESALIMSVARKQVKDIYKAFGIGCPRKILRKGIKLTIVYHDNDEPTISAKKVFAIGAFPTEENIKLSELKKQEKN